MAKVKTRRWVCPVCAAGKHAPSRPRRDDVRRFCLPCSERSGRLVERVCPANERTRERSSEVSRKKASRVRLTARKRRETKADAARITKMRLAPYERFFRRALRLKAWEVDLATRPPTATWTIAPNDGKLYRTNGRGNRRGIWVDLSGASAPDLEVILHELAHSAYDGANRGFPELDGEGRYHNGRFRTLLADAVAELTGIEVEVATSTGENDLACIRAIAAWLETPECWFRPAKS